MEQQQSQAMYLLKKVWPVFHRLLTNGLFDLLQFSKYVVRLMIRQVKGQ